MPLAIGGGLQTQSSLLFSFSTSLSVNHHERELKRNPNPIEEREEKRETLTPNFK